MQIFNIVLLKSKYLIILKRKKSHAGMSLIKEKDSPQDSKTQETEYEDVILGEIEDLRKRIIEQQKIFEERQKFLEKRLEAEMKFNLEKLKVIEKLRKERSNLIPT